MHEQSHFQSCWGEVLASNDSVYRLSCSKMVANRTDATQSLNQYRYFPEWSPLDKAFESSEFNYMQTGLFNS